MTALLVAAMPEAAARLLHPDSEVMPLGEIPASPFVLVGMVAWAVVASAVDVEAALLAGSRGVDLVLELRVDARERSAFLDDLSRIVEVREFVEPRVAEVLSGDERAVLEGLAHGQTLTDVAAALGMSRRTATRRLTSAKAALGVRTTAEALAVVGRTDVR